MMMFEGPGGGNSVGLGSGFDVGFGMAIGFSYLSLYKVRSKYRGTAIDRGQWSLLRCCSEVDDANGLGAA
jgi:hypothetical protein